MVLLSSSYPPYVRYFLKIASVISIIILVIVLTALAVYPALGLKLIWGLIIPVAPLLFFLVPNAWVSLCPFAIIQSIPHRLNISKKKELSEKQTHWLRLFGWALLFTMVPARHLLFNHDAVIVLLTVLLLAVIVLFCGYYYKGLSGWCMGFCPIRPVEMMYGQFTLERCRPEACTICDNCNVNCSRKNVQIPKILEANNSRFKYIIFTFPGFVLGYYLTGPEMGAFSLYGVIYGLSLISLILFFFLDRYCPNIKVFNQTIILALIIYYAFAVPGIAGLWDLPSVIIPFVYVCIYGIIFLNLVRYYRRTSTRSIKASDT